MAKGRGLGCDLGSRLRYWFFLSVLMGLLGLIGAVVVNGLLGVHGGGGGSRC